MQVPQKERELHPHEMSFSCFLPPLFLVPELAGCFNGIGEAMEAGTLGALKIS